MRIGLVSFWHLHGADYARAAAEHADVEVVAVWDEDHARGRKEAAARGIPFVDSLEALLADDSIDGVVICSPTSDHRDVVIACAEAGKHIFIEKVLADTVAEADEIVTAADRAGIVLTVSLWRSDKGYAHQIADLVANGTVGDITSVRVRDGHPFALATSDHPDGYLPAHFYDPATARGGVLIDLCHPVYLLALIAGLPETASSGFGHVTRRAVEDNAAVLLTYGHGAVGIAETTATSRITPFSIEVHGTAGSILYSEPGIGALVRAHREPDAPTGDTRDDIAALRVFAGVGATAGWREIEVAPDRPVAFDRWVEHATAGIPDSENTRLALELTAIIEAAYRSAATGSRVAVTRPAAIAPSSDA
jgi:1,5-anhydro-D-fructose reductase (1,5-anhydro-D-mannitol-forming)